MAEYAVKSAGAKAPAITFLIDDSPQAMEDLMQSYLFIGAGRRTHSLDGFWVTMQHMALPSTFVT